MMSTVGQILLGIALLSAASFASANPVTDIFHEAEAGLDELAANRHSENPPNVPAGLYDSLFQQHSIGKGAARPKASRRLLQQSRTPDLDAVCGTGARVNRCGSFRATQYYEDCLCTVSCGANTAAMLCADGYSYCLDSCKGLMSYEYEANICPLRCFTDIKIFKYCYCTAMEKQQCLAMVGNNVREAMQYCNALQKRGGTGRVAGDFLPNGGYPYPAGSTGTATSADNSGSNTDTTMDDSNSSNNDGIGSIHDQVEDASSSTSSSDSNGSEPNSDDNGSSVDAYSPPEWPPYPNEPGAPPPPPVHSRAL